MEISTYSFAMVAMPEGNIKIDIPANGCSNAHPVDSESNEPRTAIYAIRYTRYVQECFHNRGWGDGHRLGHAALRKEDRSTDVGLRPRAVETDTVGP